MSVLRCGISGFDTSARVDFRQFKAAAYAATQTVGAKVISSAAADGVTPSFHVIEVVLADQRVAIICNRCFPLIAIVQYPPMIAGVEFIDVPALKNALSRTGFELPLNSELERTLEAKDLEVLGSGERRQIEYWKPRRIADVIFNWWD